MILGDYAHSLSILNRNRLPQGSILAHDSSNGDSIPGQVKATIHNLRHNNHGINEFNCTDCDVDLYLQSEMIIFESILTTFVASIIF